MAAESCKHLKSEVESQKRKKEQRKGTINDSKELITVYKRGNKVKKRKDPAFLHIHLSELCFCPALAGR